LHRELLSYYVDFYSSKEQEVLRNAEPENVRIARIEATIARMEPWLLKRGWKVLGIDDQALTDCVISATRMEGRGGK
jgi:hypothetical protein